MTRDVFALVPVSGATLVREDEFIATSGEPWLSIEWPGLRRVVGKFVTVSYRTALWDAPARPLFRFLRGEIVLDESVAPGPLEATAMWTGRVPAGTTRIHISPTDRTGRFGFRVESIKRRSWRDLLIAGFRAAPGPTRSAVLTKLIGWWPESDHNLAWAINAQPLGDFDQWSSRRRRPLELNGLDHPRVDRDAVPCLQIAILASEGSDAAEIDRTLASLRAQQISPCWEALVVGAQPAKSQQDPRISYPASLADAVASIKRDDSWFCIIPAGAILRHEALAIVAERRAREPDVKLFYGDEILDRQVVLKPGWSRRLDAVSSYLGHAVFAASTLFEPAGIERLFRGEVWQVPSDIIPVPLRRVVLASPVGAAARQPPSGPPCAPPRTAEAAIIVLTHNQPALVSRLTASIRAKTPPGTYRLIIVDNGDAGGAAAAALAALGEAPDVEVLPRPGPFNFSALCNEAAASCHQEVLVFLNDDMEVLSDNWLERLVGSALEPAVGAVGAKLTYPDGRLQHVGVLVGMGGSAGHFGAPAPGDDPGWAGRNDVLHEVSAVTGACLAVARTKFEAVGGFDAVQLPIELSDIDLCLKLNARGWQTLIDPAVHLMHEESFSRGGATFRRLSKYGDQRAVFIERWRHVLRDDPVFHSALSLYSWRAALG